MLIVKCIQLTKFLKYASMANVITNSFIKIRKNSNHVKEKVGHIEKKSSNQI